MISARLSDAVFFQTEDAKKNLIDYYDKLDTVVFHKKLGTIRDKAERVAALARELAPKVGADPALAEQAAKLAKCDLVTQTVIEATSLQGQIGRLMYEREASALPNPSSSGSDPRIHNKDAKMDPRVKPEGDGVEWSASDHASIATAIEDHYKPQGPSDAAPTDPVAIAVALADKLDTLVGFWAIDEKPTGSKDPFALRRAALGLVRIILENDVRLNLERIFHTHWFRGQDKYHERQFHLPASISNLEISELKSELDQIENDEKYGLGLRSWASLLTLMGNNSLLAFILDRLKVYLRDKGIRHDIIDAALTDGQDDLVAIVNRVTALQDFLTTDDGENLLAGYKRAANILKAEAKKGDLPTGEANRPKDAHGAALFDALKIAKPAISEAVGTEDYGKALTNLANLRAPIDAFFTHTQIISDDTAVKENNLRLLSMISDTSRQIADFEAIQG